MSAFCAFVDIRKCRIRTKGRAMLLQQAIDELVGLIQAGADRDEIKDRARRLTRNVPCTREETKIPASESRKGYGFFTDDEYELANGSYMDDLTLHQTADLIGLAYDAIEARA